ncbi:DUF2178 domain-containing protein [Chloroflexota bacterium]
MNRRMLRVLTAITIVALVICITWALITGNAIIPIIALLMVTGLSYFLRKSYSEVTIDERTSLIYEKASGATIRYSVPTAGIGAVIIIAMRNHLSTDTVLVGHVLAFAGCVLLLIHLAFYFYYSRKL